MLVSEFVFEALEKINVSVFATFGPTLTDGPAMKKPAWLPTNVTAFLMALFVYVADASASELTALTNAELDKVTAGGLSANGDGDAAAIGQSSNSDVSVASGVATAGILASAVGYAASSASSKSTGGAASASSSLYLSITLP